MLLGIFLHLKDLILSNLAADHEEREAHSGDEEAHMSPSEFRQFMDRRRHRTGDQSYEPSEEEQQEVPSDSGGPCGHSTPAVSFRLVHTLPQG
jgi:hypothetical protein